MSAVCAQSGQGLKLVPLLILDIADMIVSCCSQRGNNARLHFFATPAPYAEIHVSEYEKGAASFPTQTSWQIRLRDSRRPRLPIKSPECLG